MKSIYTAVETATDTRYPTGLPRIQQIVQDYLDRHQMSQRSLSTRVGSNAGLVKDLLSGRVEYPRRRTLNALARAMGVSIEDLQGGPDVPLPDFWSRRPSRFQADQTTPAALATGRMVEIPTVIAVVDEDGRPAMADAQHSMLALPRTYLQVHLGVASPDHVRLYVAPRSTGDVRRGDHLLIDVSPSARREPGLSLVAEVDGVQLAEVEEGRQDVLARVVWQARVL